jgi:signal transduction histidine kinase
MPASRQIPAPPAWVWDIVLGALIVVASLASADDVGSGPDSWLWAVELLPAPLMLLRRRLPWVVLAAGVASYVTVTVFGVITPFSTMPAAFALFTLALARPLVVSITTAFVAALLMEAVTVPVLGFVNEATVQVIQTVGFATAVGIAVRIHRAYIAALKERADRAEASRDAEASRRVIEDRLRIARDLHDTVAHQISVISLNAGVATATLEGKPDVARDALASIRAASRNVLSEIGALLSSLRLLDETAPPAPAVGLAQLDALVQSFEQTGMNVDRVINGGIETVTPAVSSVAYRVLQESLTNAHKHGVGRHAHLAVDIVETGVHIRVTNLASAAQGTTRVAGHGLTGIRERVASVRGTVRIERPENTFRLIIDLPLTPPKGTP